MLEWPAMDTEADLHQVTAPAPPVEPRFLRGIARSAWARLVESCPELAVSANPEPWVERAAEVLARNTASGRFESSGYYQGGGTPTLLSYAQQVLTVLLAEWDRVDQLRRGDSGAWAAVIDRLERLAYHWLGPVGREEWAAWEAQDSANRTCADLWQWLQSHPYPFDVPFDRWSARALNNRLHEAARKRRLHGRYVVESLDRPVCAEGPTYGELVRVHTLEEWLEGAANRQALLQALEQLDARHARVIRLWYLEGWPADEIAADLGQQVGNIYVLRFRAMEKLRKIVLEDVRLGLAEVLRFLGDEGRRSLPVAGRRGEEEALA